MQTIYTAKMPACVYGGEGSLSQLKDILAQLGASRVLIFTDAGVRSAGLLEEALTLLEQAGAQALVLDGIPAEPSYRQVEEVIEQAASFDAQVVLAVGGGSVMDSAKLYTLVKDAPYTIIDLLLNPALGKKSLPSIMVPTTCGTGSEATGNAIVAVPEDEVKVGIVNSAMIPDAVILDPRMLAKLPGAILAATGVDALAHAVECFTSNKANPLSDAFARYAAQLIFKSLRKAYMDPIDLAAKNDLLIGAFYGGMAISASGTTAVHALSYPLGGKYHIPHGVSNAILFAPVMAFNLPACRDRLAALADLMHPAGGNATEAERAQYVVDEIAALVRAVEIPTSLCELGVGEDALDGLVTAATGVTRLLNNNRRPLSPEDIRSIYLQVM